MFHPTTRRAALGVVGVGGLGALTACGTDTGQAGAAVSSAASQAASLASSAASQATSAAASAAGDAIAKVEIPVGGGKIIDAIKVVITQPTAGDFKAFSAVCTHQGCTVSSVSGGTINCACHGSTFDIATGAVTSGPATKPLPAKTVTVGADGITIT